MEIELKYKIDNKDMLDTIYNDKYIEEVLEPNTREELLMRGVYYDTADRILSQNGIALRMRNEGDRSVATLKCKDKPQVQPGLYLRQEVNVPITEERLFHNPKPDIFIESEEGRGLLEILKGEPLLPLLSMEFTRRKLRIDDEGAICEVALDLGEIKANSKTCPICELEVELYSGKKAGLLKIGDKLVDKYQLVPEPKSKFDRGIELL